jgi:hypothetical protein
VLPPIRRSDRPSGQIVVMFAIVLAVVVLSVGLVIDGGYALVQRRASQNASDFAAIAGARIIAENVVGNTTDGTDANVQAAITNAVQVNGGRPVTFGSPNGPRYVDANGGLLGYVGTGAIPATAVGVHVQSDRSWTPYFLGIIGMSNWTASAEATAKGGYAAGGPPPGTLFPAGISTSFFQTYPYCSGPISGNPGNACHPVHLTPGNLNVPGGFGWLKYGCDYGLGQGSNGGCDDNAPFLQGEMGPPSNSYGCCSAVNAPGSDPDRVGSLPGNKVSVDCDYYINNQITVTVPIWDVAGGTGSNAWYHIVGFAGFQLTACSGGKDIEGVWRKAFFLGPTTSTPSNPGVPQAAAVQLVK